MLAMKSHLRDEISELTLRLLWREDESTIAKWHQAPGMIAEHRFHSPPTEQPMLRVQVLLHVATAAYERAVQHCGLEVPGLEVVRTDLLLSNTTDADRRRPNNTRCGMSRMLWEMSGPLEIQPNLALEVSDPSRD